MAKLLNGGHLTIPCYLLSPYVFLGGFFCYHRITDRCYLYLQHNQLLLFVIIISNNHCYLLSSHQQPFCLFAILLAIDVDCVTCCCCFLPYYQMFLFVTILQTAVIYCYRTLSISTTPQIYHYQIWFMAPFVFLVESTLSTSKRTHF